MGSDLSGQVWAPLLLMTILMAFLALGTLWLLGVRTHNKQHRWAMLHGLRYYEHDPRLRHIDFVRTETLSTNRVITGQYRGRTVLAVQNDRAGSGELPTRTTETRIAVLTPSRVPVVEVEARSTGPSARVIDIFGRQAHTALDGIPTGNPEFDERFVVRCDDPRFTKLLLSTELMRRLVDRAAVRQFWGCRFVDGMIAIDSARELEKVDIIARFNFLIDFASGVDPSVWHYRWDRLDGLPPVTDKGLSPG